MPQICFECFLILPAGRQSPGEGRAGQFPPAQVELHSQVAFDIDTIDQLIQCTDSRLLATVGAFRVVSQSDLEGGRDRTEDARKSLAP
jgi:hypothetical protein